MFRATVPEATVNEHGNPLAGKNDIDNDALYSPVKTETQTFGMKLRAEGTLGLRVPGLYSLHDLRACEWLPVYRFCPFLCMYPKFFDLIASIALANGSVRKDIPSRIPWL